MRAGRAGARLDSEPKLAPSGGGVGWGGGGGDQRKAPRSFCTTANTAPLGSQPMKIVLPNRVGLGRGKGKGRGRVGVSGLAW